MITFDAPRWASAVADQGVVALANLALSVSIARSSGLQALGTAALLVAAIQVCLGMCRTLLSDPYLAGRDTGVRSALAHARYFLSRGALLTALLILVVVLVIRPDENAWLLVPIIGALVLMQDFGRYCAFKAEKPGRALISDLWILFCVGTTAILTFTSQARISLPVVLLAWFTGLTFSILPLRRYVMGRTLALGSRSWWQTRCRALALPLLQDSFAYMISSNVSLYVVAAFAATEEIGIIRIVYSLFSPAALFFTGLTMWLVPTLASGHTVSREFLIRTSMATTGIATLLLIIMIVIGPNLALLIFREAPSRGDIVAAGLITWLSAVAAPWQAGAKVLNRYGGIAWTRTFTSVSLIGLLAMLHIFQSSTGYLLLQAAQCLAIAVAAVLAVIGSQQTRPHPRIS